MARLMEEGNLRSLRGLSLGIWLLVECVSRRLVAEIVHPQALCRSDSTPCRPYGTPVFATKYVSASTLRTRCQHDTSRMQPIAATSRSLTKRPLFICSHLRVSFNSLQAFL